MKIIKKLLPLLFFSFLILYDTCDSIAQVDITLNPYINPYTRNGQTIGGASVALADSVPVTFHNPANIANLKQVSVFASLNYGRSYIHPVPSDINIASRKWDNDFYVNSFAVSLPFNIFNSAGTVAASYNGNEPYDHELEYSGLQVKTSGRSHLVSLGLAFRTISDFRIGGGWTRWFGNYEQMNTQPVEFPLWDNIQADYDANIYYVGLQNKLSEHLSLGMVFYFPFDLTIRNKSPFSDTQEQEFSGTLRLGLGYFLGEDWRIGLGYSYQKAEVYEKDLSTISGGIGYTLRLNGLSMPLYIMYETILFPATLDQYNSFYGEKRFTYQLLGAGAGIQLNQVSLYLSATWARYGDYFRTPMYYLPYPPWS